MLISIIPVIFSPVSISLSTICRSSRKFPLPERTVYVPSFGTKIHAGKRKNDRFAYGSVTAMRVSNSGAGS